MPLVLFFHLQGTASAAEKVNWAVRGGYTAGEATVASVVDLSLVPTVGGGDGVVSGVRHGGDLDETALALLESADTRR